MLAETLVNLFSSAVSALPKLVICHFCFVYREYTKLRILKYIALVDMAHFQSS